MNKEILDGREACLTAHHHWGFSIT